eukprot:gene15137-17916_t
MPGGGSSRRLMRQLWMVLKRRIVAVVLAAILILHIVVIYQYTSNRYHSDRQRDQLASEFVNLVQLRRMSAMDPQNIIDNHKDLFKRVDGKDPVLIMPQICREKASTKALAKCEGPQHYTPVVTPGPVLDPVAMDYEIKPGTPTRAKFGYYPAADSDEPPIITILTPFYNIGPILHETAASVLGQSLQAFQWIIVNDGSPNKTLVRDSLGPYRAMKDPRILILDLPKNVGLPGARNEALKHATGRYLVLLDPDDLIEHTYLEKAVWFLETHPHYTLTNAWSIGFGHKEYTWQKGYQNGDINLKENMITVASVMRTEILRKIGGFDAKLKTGMEDWDLWMRMADNGHWGHTLEEFHFWYRVSPPGKWASIYNETKFNEFMAGQKRKYPTAFSQGVPKLSRPAQGKMESVEDVLPITNKLRKCRPRLLIVIPYMEIGGADQFNFNFAAGLSLAGWEVSIAATKEAANKWMPQFLRVTPDIFVMPRFLKATDQTRFLVYLIKSRDFDIVFLSNSEGAYHYLPYLRAHAPGPAYVDYTHSETPAWKNGGYARYSVGAEPFLDRAIFASEHLRRYVVDRGHNPNKTATVLIGIDSEKYAPRPEARQDIREELGFPDGVLVIVYVARLESEKQPEMFAEVLRRMDSAGYDFRAISIGGGALFGALNETIISTGLSKKVTLLGSIPNKDVARYVAGSDVFFLPSKVEGISLAIYEAMSMGVCAVAAKVGGQAELVTPDVGYLVKPGTPTECDEYYDILATLSADLPHVAALGKASRAKILGGFSVHDTIAKLEREFCSASIVAQLSGRMFANDAMAPIVKEMAVLGYEYERATDELLPIWNELTETVKKCAPPPAPPAPPVRPPSPYPASSPEDVLESIDLTRLRVVTDLLDEKRTTDRKMRVTLHDHQAAHSRRTPRVADEAFKTADFLHPLNHDVDVWDDDIPYPFAAQEYVAVIKDAFIGSGESGTVFDWERVFLLSRGRKPAFTLPTDNVGMCQVKTFKKVFSTLQLYMSYTNFIQEQMPKIALAWDTLQSDEEMHIIVPNIPYAHTIMEQLLKVPAQRILYFNPGAGWDPCTIFFAQEVHLPTPIPTGHPPREMIHNMRNIIMRSNNLPTYAEEDTPKFASGNVVIYASRQLTQSKQRKVNNEDELIEAIRNSLPSSLTLEVWSGEEVLNSTVLEMASKAKMIIGMTGSNLAPMVASRPGTIVIELMHENPWLSWWATAEALSHSYWMVPVKGFTHESESIAAPINDVIKTIKQALSTSDHHQHQPKAARVK